MASTARPLELDDVQKILGRALVDATFRNELLNDTETVFVALGLDQSEESLNFFKALNENSFLEAADQIENRLGGRPVIAAWLRPALPQ